MYKNFLEDCLANKASLSDLDTYVSYWHTKETESSLQEFLGITDYEYNQWMLHDDSIFRAILYCRKVDMPFAEYVKRSREDY